MWHVARHDHSGCADFWTLGIFENFVLFVDVSFIQVDHNSWAQPNTCFRTINNNSHTCNYVEFTWFAFYSGWSNLFVYDILEFNGETNAVSNWSFFFLNETPKCSDRWWCDSQMCFTQIMMKNYRMNATFDQKHFPNASSREHRIPICNSIGWHLVPYTMRWNIL